MDKPPHRISVKHLIEICLKKGDLSRGYASRTRALEGIREHTRIQRSRPTHYKKEVPVSVSVSQSHTALEIYGRVDGIFDAGGEIVVEEIKTCRADPDQKAAAPSLLHMAQLKCYGHMVAVQKNLSQVTLLLTYVRVGTQSIAENRAVYPAEDLRHFFDGLAADYIRLIEDRENRHRVRNASIAQLEFPYNTFRKGQRELAESAYKIIKNERILFARAPTGTGKTIATLFPAVKSLGLGQIDKIFYLTAKTVGRTVALKALDAMRQKGGKLNTTVITAKQKTCLVSDESCDMETCPYAKNYFNKLADAMPHIRVHDTFDQPLLESLGRQYELCPFELSLDASLFCDVIICDVNYCFDPRVYLKRYFDFGRPKVTFLIDEAHNLHERLRSMYSAHLLKSDVLTVQQLVREPLPDIAGSLAAVHKEMLRLKQQCREADAGFISGSDPPEALLSKIGDFTVKADRWLDRNREESPVRSGLLDFFYQANTLLAISSYFDSNYQFYIERIGEHDLLVRLFCMDPSPIFSDLIKRCRSSILFSATLTPIEFHQKMLFDETIDPFSIVLPSPFPAEHFKVFLHRGIRTTYRTRQHYYKEIAGLIRDVTAARNGNYLIYFPSYAFLNAVADQLDDGTKGTVMVQEPGMTETQRQDFLAAFTPGSAVTGFAVMGGIFGEGIDLTGDRLIGAVIISAGVPQVCPERDLIRAYHDDRDGSGFLKSYRVPGFNRVQQAAGRVIRTDTDKGMIVLVDERFDRPEYRNLFPGEWKEVHVVSDTRQLINGIRGFWETVC